MNEETKDLIETLAKDLTQEDIIRGEERAKGYAEGFKDGVGSSRPTWIPCSERLPEDVQIGDEYPTVIFCTKEHTYAGFYEYYLGGRWWAEDGDYVVDDVIAWMPLPEPWKGAEE